MTNWWRAPLIAAAISTLACGLIDSCYRRQADDIDEKLEALTNEWRSDPQLSAQLDRERDVAGMLDVRREATAFVRAKQPSTYATLGAIVPPANLNALTLNAARKRFRISGPAALQAATEAYLARDKRVHITNRRVSGPSFVIDGVVE